jgi:hypothetical protein
MRNNAPTTWHERFTINPMGCTSYQEFGRVKDAFPADEFLRHWRGEHPDALGKLEVYDGNNLVRSWGVTKRMHIVECVRIAVSLPELQTVRRRVMRVFPKANAELLKEWAA